MVTALGHSLIQKVRDFLYMIGYLGKLITASFFFAKRGKTARKILTMQLLFTYVEALPICCFLAAGIGSSVFMIANNFLTALGQDKLKYDLMVLLIMRELGPILIAFIVTARSATAIATEISTMVVRHEIEAYISVGIDPIAHIAAPRFLGVTFSLFFLNIYFSLFGLLCPAIIIQFVSTTSISDYLMNIFLALDLKIILISILKSIVFGMIISGAATLYGFSAGRAFTEIPMAGLRAVSKAFLYIIIADAFITILSYTF
ncbi:MAG: ABC transporter permease [Treponema sp.]|nr:ABC transporter permease [Treponema sp.]